MTIQVTVSLFLVFTVAAFCKRIKIVGGTFSLIRDCPYLASLRYIPNNEHVCAATILTPQHILTAAHCVQESFINFLDLKVLTGTSDVFIHEGNSYLLEKYFIYPEFSAQLNDKIVHYLDIAIVKIFGFIEFNEYQKKINLPTRNVLPADFGILSGWGALTYPSNGASNILQKAWMTVVDNNYCKNYVPFYINSDQFCAFQKKSVGPCIGDGGSPLVGSNDTILGILSVSIPCAIVYGKEDRIIGGSNAVRNHFPYQAVLKRISDNVVICGGAIISHYHILTAAHCVDEHSITYSNLKICLGGFNQTHEFVSEYLPYQIIIHPGYTGNSNEIRTLSNDIALIRTRQDIQFNYYQNLISLPKRNIYPDEACTFSGWGAKTYPLVTFPDRLQRILMKVISRPTCQTTVPFILRADQFCAFKAPGIGPCIGDGGSPLNRLGKLVGIFSMGNLCAQGVPDIFTNVFAHLPFIMSSMEL